MSEGLNPPGSKKKGFTKLEIEFIQKHLNDDTHSLILKSNNYKEVDARKLAAQILSRQKAQKKLPEWSAIPGLMFPAIVSVEQSSSEATAKYKAGLVSGKRLIDVTGGMGVDCYYMSRHFEKADYFEQQTEVAETAEFNFEQLSAKNIQVHSENSIDSLNNTTLTGDWLYADPARRGSNKEKVVLLADCTPDILANLDLLLLNAPNVLLKTSPLLDIDLAVTQLKYVSEVHIVGYEQECKELLFILNKSSKSDQILLKSVILNGSGQVVQALTFTRRQENEVIQSFSKPLSFLYEPHPAMLKAGAFKVISQEFNLYKLASNSHLYTSSNRVLNFPGRSFEVIAICKPDIKEISKYIDGDKANLTTRNFPAKIQDLRKKWRLKDGGDFYLFATTLEDKTKVVVVTRK